METEIRTWLLRYLVGDVTREELEDWLAPASWDLDEVDPRAAEFAYSVQLLLAERSAGHLDEGEMTAHLRRLVESAHLGEPVGSTTGSSASTVPTPWAVHQLAAAGR